MGKGKLGVRICFYTVSAFVLAALGQSLLLFLLAGMVLVVEKDEWGIRQIIQAIVLCLINNVVSSLMSIFDFLYNIPIISRMWGAVDSIVSAVIGIAVLAFCIVGILKNIKGQDASIPLADKFADWAYGVVRKPAAPVAPAPAAPAQAAPVAPAPVAPAASAPEKNDNTAS